MKIYKQTEIIQLSNILKNDGVLAVPTDTVYGLCARMNSKKARENTVNDKDKPEILPIVKKPAKHGYSIFATSGTASYLKENGVENIESVPKIWEGTDSIPDLIHSGQLSFIINTPTKGKESNRDGFKIRRLAAESKVPCFTAIDTVIGFYDAIAKGLKEEDLELVNVGEI